MENVSKKASMKLISPFAAMENAKLVKEIFQTWLEIIKCLAKVNLKFSYDVLNTPYQTLQLP